MKVVFLEYRSLFVRSHLLTGPHHGFGRRTLTRMEGFMGATGGGPPFRTSSCPFCRLSSTSHPGPLRRTNGLIGKRRLRVKSDNYHQ